MEILLWLVPPAVVTVVAMVWVSWLGREGRGEVDRDVAVRRLGEALERSKPVPSRATGRPADAPTRQPDRSTGIAVRRSSAPRPVPAPVVPPVEPPRERPDEQPQRRVS
ncbi:hypothetical protein [Nocardioides psychrotolerans]|uniref:hypothetical protein n=1 Tax=Nocardioides psychrotolerans TaxID=1005945 RepID=UPI00313832C0